MIITAYSCLQCYNEARTHARKHARSHVQRKAHMTQAHVIPKKRFPTSHERLTATFVLPVEMGFDSEKEFPNRKRLRRYIRSKGYSIKDLQVIENKNNTNVKITIPHFKA